MTLIPIHSLSRSDLRRLGSNVLAAVAEEHARPGSKQRPKAPHRPEDSGRHRSVGS